MDSNEIIIMALEMEAPNMSKWDNVFFTGIGKVNAAALTMDLLCNYPYVQKVWNFGTAGGITVGEGLHRCTTFVQRDMKCEPMGYKTGQTPWEDDVEITIGLGGLTCSTGDNFVTDPNDPLLGDIVDMEAYAIAKICLRLGVQFECYKYISDKADTDSPDSWRSNVSKGEEYFIKVYEDGGELGRK